MLLLFRGHKKGAAFSHAREKCKNMKKFSLFLNDELFGLDNPAVDLEVAEVNAFVQIGD